MRTIDILKNFTLDVYCQTCGAGLTEAGGYVADNGEIYCVENSNCLNEGVLSETEGIGVVVADFYDPKKVQEAIRKGELAKFGPLEREVDE